MSSRNHDLYAAFLSTNHAFVKALFLRYGIQADRFRYSPEDPEPGPVARAREACRAADSAFHAIAI